jgi:hypothetical protein
MHRRPYTQALIRHADCCALHVHYMRTYGKFVTLHHVLVEQVFHFKIETKIKIDSSIEVPYRPSHKHSALEISKLLPYK